MLLSLALFPTLQQAEGTEQLCCECPALQAVPDAALESLLCPPSSQAPNSPCLQDV